MNLRRLFKELYFEKFEDENGLNPDAFNIDWENIIFYTEQPKNDTVNMVVYFKHQDKNTWNRANIVINTDKFRIENLEFIRPDNGQSTIVDPSNYVPAV